MELFLVGQVRRREEILRINNKICVQIDGVFWRDYPFGVSKEIIHVPCPLCDYKMTDQVVTGVGLAKETLIWKLEEVPSYLCG